MSVRVPASFQRKGKQGRPRNSFSRFCMNFACIWLERGFKCSARRRGVGGGSRLTLCRRRRRSGGLLRCRRDCTNDVSVRVHLHDRAGRQSDNRCFRCLNFWLTCFLRQIGNLFFERTDHGIFIVFRRFLFCARLCFLCCRGCGRYRCGSRDLNLLYLRYRSKNIPNAPSQRIPPRGERNLWRDKETDRENHEGLFMEFHIHWLMAYGETEIVAVFFPPTPEL